MYSISNNIWNQISAQYELKTEWAKRMFSYQTQEELNIAIEEEVEKFINSGIDPILAVAIVTVLPLVLENEAIRKINEKEKWFPPIREVENLEEAIIIAAHEYRTLTEMDLKQMRGIIQSIIDAEETNWILDEMISRNILKRKETDYPIQEDILFSNTSGYFEYNGYSFMIDFTLPKQIREQIKLNIQHVIDKVKYI